jgi:uncharacterized membrane protein (UPF0182 family)
MRAPQDLPRRQRRPIRGRVWILVGLVVLFILLTSLRSLAGFYTDYLWFQELHFTSVFRGVLVTQVLLAVFFTALFMALMLGNLTIADRIAPKFRAVGPEDEIVQRYREAIGPHAGKVRVIVSLIFALFVGIGTRSQWNNWLLFIHASSFPQTDPQFHKNIGFYVFQLPFINFVLNWLFVALIITLVITVIFHYLNGGIRVQSPGQRVTPQVKAHISVLLGALALVKAVGYWFERYGLTLSTKHVVDGATYTSVHADLPAKNLLILIAVAAAVLFIINIRHKGWTLPIIAVALWGLVWVLVGGIYPAFIQAVQVDPSENVKERPYITRNIASTRTAFGINNVATRPFQGAADLTASAVAQGTTNFQSLQNIRLLDPAFVGDAFNRLQEIRTYYQFNDLDIDRYVINGQMAPTLSAVRELNSSDVPSGFVNKHLQYTHGYGAVLSEANQDGVNPADGTPNFLLSDIPPVAPAGTPQLNTDQGPKVYYGEGQSGYVIVKSKQPELDYQDKAGNNVTSQYGGTGGVPMGSILRRVAFFLRFGDINPLISGQVTSRSRIMYVRDIQARVRKAAPFLKYDSDPYAVILNGRMYWVQDAYTVTSRYPYSQRANLDRMPANSGLQTQFNYVRNSVKVVIDAYNGSIRFYVVDPTDPIVKTYMKAFPKLFTPGDQMDKLNPGLRAHLRYPEDLFRVQTNMYGRYHLTDPNGFYTQANAWTISQDPGSGSPAAAQVVPQLGPNGQPLPPRQKRMDPTYLLTTLPGETQQSFLILQPFVPVSPSDKQQNLTAFMTAKSDPGNYGQLEAFVTPPGQLIDGPALVNSAINANSDISKEITLLNQQGSQVKLGNVITVPINQSLVYVQPLYIQAQTNPVPRLDDVIVVYNGQAVHGGSLNSALCQLPFGQQFCALPGGNLPPPSQQVNNSTGTSTGTTTTPSTTPSGGSSTTAPPSTGPPANATISQLLADAQAHFSNAQTALKNGDLATYQREIQAAQADVQQAQSLAAAASPGSTVPPSTTTPTSVPPTTAPKPSSPPSTAAALGGKGPTGPSP